jgi:predicted amidohydrolase YtcJ
LRVRTLYRNGRIYSPAAREATALLVEDDLITWVGDEAGVGQHAGVGVVDLAGAFLTPAFVDAHVHLTGTGIALMGLDLAGVPSLADALARVEEAARTHAAPILVGGGWDDTDWPERRPPSSAELDRAASGRPVYLARVDRHSASVSSALLAALPDGLQGFRSEGWLTGAAARAARQLAFDALGAADTERLQRAALQHATQLGIAGVHEMAGPELSSAEDLQSALALGALPELPEVLGYWGELGGAATARELGAIGAAGDLSCDGSFGSHTAALSEPYTDDPSGRGTLRFDTAQLVAHVLDCCRLGVQFGFHAIGDAAVDQVIEVVEIASAQLGRPVGPGNRVEHVEFLTDPARFARTGMLASMQPMFDALWGGSDGMYAERLGPRRAAKLNRFADLAAAGVPLAFGSDAPVTPLGPWAAVRAAAFPTDPAAGISPRAAFAASTRAGWRAARRDGEGVLAPGARATMAAWHAGELAVDAPDERVARWSTDPRAAVPGLPDVAPGTPLPTCLATWRRGRVLFDGGALERARLG